MTKDLVFDLLEQEKTRQREGLELIPSENYVSADVLAATPIWRWRSWTPMR